jgi:N-acetylglucosamine-6-phosphate deacetylase
VMLEDAVRMASATPAAFLGLREAGSIAEGKWADLLLADDELSVRRTWICGAAA